MIQTGTTMNEVVDQDPKIHHQEQDASCRHSRVRRSRSVSGVKGHAGISPMRNGSIRLSPPRRSTAYISPVRDRSSSTTTAPATLKGLGGLGVLGASSSALLKRQSTTETAASSKSSHASLDLTVDLVQGEDLTACDKNFFGKQTTSDPYVIVSILCEGDEIVIGQTKHIKSNLNPKWNATLTKVIPPGTLKSDNYTLQFKLMDKDLFGNDDCMGIVKIPMYMDKISKACNWYDIPKDSAPNAKGRIQLGVETKLQYAMDSFLANRRNNQSQIHLLEKEDDNDNNNNHHGKEQAAAAPFKRSSSISAAFFGAAGNNNKEQLSPTKGQLPPTTKAQNPTTKPRSASIMGGGATTTASNMFMGAGTAAATTFIGAGTAMADAAMGAGNVMASAAYGAGTVATQGAGAAASMATTATTSAAGAMVGMLTAPTALLRRGTKTVKAQENPDEYENIYKDEPVLNLQLTVHQGDGLVAKDRNVIGLKTSSDPYIIVEVWPKGIPNELEKNGKDYPKIQFGRSPTIHKNLSPVWNHSFEPFNVPLEKLDMEEAQLRIRILDDDFGIGDDDPMGSIDVYLQPTKNLDVAEKWYHVSATSCSRASGRVQISLMTLQAKQSTLVGKKKKEKAAVKKETGCKDTNAKLMEALNRSRSVFNHDPSSLLDRSRSVINHDPATLLHQSRSVINHDPAGGTTALDQLGGSMPGRYSMSNEDYDDDPAAAVGSTLMAADRDRRAIPKSRLRKQTSVPETVEKQRSRNEIRRNVKERQSRRKSMGAEVRDRSSRRASSRTDRRLRSSQSHIPTKEGGAVDNTIPSSSALPRNSPRSSSILRKTSADKRTSAADKKEESRRERSSRRDVTDDDGGLGGSRKRTSKSGRSRPSRTSNKEMKDGSSNEMKDASAESNSSLRSGEDRDDNRDSPASPGGEKKRISKSSHRKSSSRHVSSSHHNEEGKRMSKSSRRTDGSSRRNVHGDEKRRSTSKKRISGGGGNGGGAEREPEVPGSRSIRGIDAWAAAADNSTSRRNESMRRKTSQTKRPSSERVHKTTRRSSNEKERPRPTKQPSPRDVMDQVPELKAYDDKNRGSDDDSDVVQIRY